MESGNFASPNWPRAYPTRTTCQWTITVPDPNLVIHFALDPSEYGFPTTSPPCQDKVEILDGVGTNATSLAVLCGGSTGVLDYWISSGNQAKVLFTSGAIRSHRDSGFRMLFRGVERCRSGYQRYGNGLSCEGNASPNCREMHKYNTGAFCVVASKWACITQGIYSDHKLFLICQ